MKLIRLLKANNNRYTIWLEGLNGLVEEIEAENLTEQQVIDWTKRYLYDYWRDCRKDCKRGEKFTYLSAEVNNLEDAKMVLKEIAGMCLSYSDDLDTVLNDTYNSTEDIVEYVDKKPELGIGEIDTENWTDEDWMRTGQ